MSTVVEAVPGVAEKNGAAGAEAVETPPAAEPKPIVRQASKRRRAAMIAMPFVVSFAWTAAFVIARRRRAKSDDKPSGGQVDWKFLSSNSVTFRPTFAPTFEGLRLPGRWGRRRR